MEPAVNFVPLRGPFELERAQLQFPWLANLARDKTVTVYLAWNLTPVPRIVGVAAWRRTDSEFAKVWWDILPAYYETVTASQLLEHICTHAQASGVKELISAQMFAENSPQAKDLIAAGFVPSRCNEQFVVPFTIGMERTSRIAEKWKQRSRIKSHNSFFVRPFVAADAQSVWQFPGIAPLFSLLMFQQAMRSNSFGEISQVAVRQDKLVGLILAQRNGSNRVDIPAMAVDPGCSQKEVIASLLTYHVCKRVSELYPAMKHKVEFYFRADPQANPATARICRGFNGRILPPIWSFQKALTFQSEAYAGELLTID